MFAHQVSSASLNSIQRIVPAQWEQTWSLVSGMQGLQDVRVKFLDARTGERGVELSDPLSEIKRGLRVFDLRMVPGFSGAARSAASEKAPLVLREAGTSRRPK